MPNKVTVVQEDPKSATPEVGRFYRFRNLNLNSLPGRVYMYVRGYGSSKGNFFVNMNTGLQCNPDLRSFSLELIEGPVTIEPEP